MHSLYEVEFNVKKGSCRKNRNLSLKKIHLFIRRKRWCLEATHYNFPVIIFLLKCQIQGYFMTFSLVTSK